jgi:hypothetical protein
MPQSTLNTQRPREWELALRREMQMGIGQQLRKELPPELTSKVKDKEHDPYAEIVGTC